MILNQLNKEVEIQERRLVAHKTSLKVARVHTQLAVQTIATRPSTLTLSFMSGLAYGLIQKEPPGENKQKEKSSRLKRVLKLSSKLAFTRILSAFAADLV